MMPRLQSDRMRDVAETVLFSSELASAAGPRTARWTHANILDVEPEDSGLGIPETLTAAFFARDTRPRLDETQNGTLIILRGANRNPDADPEDMLSLRIYTDGTNVFSAERYPVYAARHTRDYIDAAEEPLNAGDVVAQLAARLVENLAPVHAKIMDTIDELEEAIIAEDIPSPERKELLQQRRRILVLRRYLMPERDVISRLLASEATWLERPARRVLREAEDKLLRFLEDMDAQRERLQILYEELLTQISDKLNTNTYTLSVVAALFLPLGFLTGLLGVNIAGMPGTEDVNAFWIFCTVMVVIAAVQIWWFRRKGWF